MDQPSEIHAVGRIDGGKRFMMSNPGGFINRDAWGMLHDLRSSVPHLIPGQVQYIRGTCRDNFGQECFGLNVCHCYGENAASGKIGTGSTGGCRGGVGGGETFETQLIDGLWQDEQLAMGYRWPVQNMQDTRLQSGHSLHCRRFQDTLDGGNQKVSTDQGRVDEMIPPVLLRLSGPCTTNPLAGCTTRVDGAEGKCFFSFQNDPMRTSSHYNTGGNVSDFHEIAFDSTAFFKDATPNAQIKNRILSFVNAPFDFGPWHSGGLLKFDRLDHNYGGTGFPESSSGLSVFSRTWDGGAFAVEDRPRVLPFVFGNCVTLGTRHALKCTLHVERVEYHMIFVPQLVSVNEQSMIEPQARITMRIECSVAAEWEDPDVPHTLERPWLNEDDPNRSVNLMIVNGGKSPKIVQEGDPNGVELDRILYRDVDQNSVDPPYRLDWMGFLGASSVPSKFDERKGNDIAPLNVLCIQLASHTFTVPGVPTFVTRSDDQKNAIYGGSVRIRFRP
jgi:hypothetical protein